MKKLSNHNRQAYEHYFSTHFHSFQDTGPDSDWDYYEKNLLHLLPKDKNANILEIGSGLGKFAYFLKKLGYTHVTCIDISPELTRLAKEYSNIDVVLVDEPMDFFSMHCSHYEMVIMLDVIEHIRKDIVIEYLTLVRHTIKTHGSLLVSTENMASPVGGRIQHYLDFTHEYNYSEFSLAQVLQISGFSQINIFSMKDAAPRSIKGHLASTLRKGWFWMLWLIYKIERPGSPIPKHFDKELLATAKKA